MKPILLVNDDPKLVGEITRVFDNEHFIYRTASTAAEALELAKDLDFSMLFLDLKLPDMDGDELYEKMLKAESHYVLPVVVLLDSLDAEEVPVLNRLFPMGTVTILSKPLNESWIVDLCSKYAEREAVITAG